ncbi:glycerophosphodiester phosphodiesterase [Chitinophaga horti]|uniref:Glycerophosphodiester phosphodiesterase n=1 Tax=Chitinophaga horti TaxID=2920382 RepID=A0ABY6J5Y7_9BACT|nr:glycerophosphodiester phosphodiesterase [Chitinophaga horti]UYQ93662.1 glycerophosphodiester phosphodiesterase [Chitinophaga horti]
MKNAIKGVLAACLLIAACTSPKKATTQTDVAFPAFDKEGHRGSRGLMPENTIPAMKKAIDVGATTLEMDAAISRDKQVIVSHDPYFNHLITTTPDGKSFTKAEEKQYALYKMTYDEIKRFDVGAKGNPGFPEQQKMAVHKPLLADLIAASEAYAKEKGVKPVWYNIETKCQPATDNQLHPAPQEFVDLLVKVVDQQGVTDRTVIQSFDRRTLQVLHKQHPAIKTSYLVAATAKKSLGEYIAELGFTPFALSPYYTMVDADMVKACKAAGIKLVPWTVNEKAEIIRLKQLGVDGIITDYPNLFAEAGF